jgi:hypothetical protein
VVASNIEERTNINLAKKALGMSVYPIGNIKRKTEKGKYLEWKTLYKAK